MTGEVDSDPVRPYAEALAGGIEEAIPSWVEGCVARIMTAWAGHVPSEVAGEAGRAGERARAETAPAVRALLLCDIDEQTSTPLAILRRAVSYPTAVLRAAGVPPVERDRFAEAAFPDDRYGLSPASLADVSPALVDVGVAWGAAKAFEHRRRHA